MNIKSPPSHPGQFVRDTVLKPRALSVTEAAKLIGISRPGVSNFLNGKVGATPDMAARIERVFGVSTKIILNLQSEYDAHAAKTNGVEQKTKAYVPAFLDVRANDIIDWFATTIAARTKLAVLLRTMIHSTGTDLSKVDFPGNDDAERPGWDGLVDAKSGTPWIPVGISGWEFGVTANVQTKANGDFVKSVKGTKKAERDNITFVFVTPRRWPGKIAWIADKKAKAQWKDVRAYDASDLEQWMEKSLAAQTWFANQTERPSSGVRTLERCWSDWSNVTAPPLHPLLFATPIKVWREKIEKFVDGTPSGPLVISADSVEEALAFLSQVLAEPEFERHKDRVLVFDEPRVLPRLAQGATDFIAVAHTRDVEREFGPYHASLRTVVIYPRNATNAEPDIVLEPLGYEAFNIALEAMEKKRDDQISLANESGRSVTILRRRLSTNLAIQKPLWAEDHKTSAGLIPFVLVGAWDARNEADQIAISLLAGGISFEILDKRLQELAPLNDAPVWSIGDYRGVVSKIDSLFAIAGAFTKDDIDRFLALARMVLGEDDPALDLPEKDRWAAAMHEKKREFSGAVREGISETLVLLAVHGKSLFGKRLGFDGELAAAKLIRELLEPISTRTLEANDRDLPLYAEAAPSEFLNIIERDLRAAHPETFGLLRSADTGIFGSSCPRTGLLWALEGLAWNTTTFPRVVKILARLSEVEINDNWANKPIKSLGAIFRAWMPQTEVGHAGRLKAVHMLFDKFPTVGWTICTEQFGDYGHRVGDYSHKPKWRPDGYGFGEPFETWAPIHDFAREMIEFALNRTAYSVEMLCDLVNRLHGLGADYQTRVWTIIDEWHKAGASDEDIAKLREKIRVTVLSQRRRRLAGDDERHASLSKKAKLIYESMQPTEVVNRHEWLFRQHWVEESADELNDETDFHARDKRVERLRCEALSEIFSERGLEGIFSLASKGNSQRQIGAYLSREVLDSAQIQTFALECLRPNIAEPGRFDLLAGAVWAMDLSDRASLYDGLRPSLTDAENLQALLLFPYRRATWKLVESLPNEDRAHYWREVIPQMIFDDPDENNEGTKHLLEAERPRAAFVAMHFKLDDLRQPLLFKILSDIARGIGSDKDGEYRLQDYEVQKAFQLIDRNPDISLEDKAGLEFAYLDVLARSFRGGDGHNISNLERYIEEHPDMFVQAVVWAYRRKGRGEDPPEYQVPEGQQGLATKGHRLLEALEKIPGQGKPNADEQRAKLFEWVSIVRKSCAELDRVDIADVCLGKLFASAPIGNDGVWPNEIVRDVMEELQSEEVSNGAHTGLYNARGVHWRGEGGEQERELADKYRKWADALQFTHPFVSSSLLMSMVRTYEYEAEQQDTEAGIRRRLRH